jgi:hypothetical protein
VENHMKSGIFSSKIQKRQPFYSKFSAPSALIFVISHKAGVVFGHDRLLDKGEGGTFAKNIFFFIVLCKVTFV